MKIYHYYHLLLLYIFIKLKISRTNEVERLLSNLFMIYSIQVPIVENSDPSQV